MKRLAGLLLAALLVTGAMLLPATLQVNNSSHNSYWTADGNGPVPPWPPQHSSPTPASINSYDDLIADGNGPVPPWPPQRSSSTGLNQVTV
jgi:hypothetical protein